LASSPPTSTRARRGPLAPAPPFPRR
jgi:hypothetical protein